MRIDNRSRSVSKSMTLRFRPPFHALIIGPDEVIIKSGIWSGSSSSLVDKGRAGLVGRIIRAIDGMCPVQDIIGQVGAEHEEPILDLLDRLIKSGFLQEVPREVGTEELPVELRERLLPAQSFLSVISSQPLSLTLSRLRKARVCILSGGVIAARIALQLAQSGIGRLCVVDSREVADADLYMTPWLMPKSIGENRGQVLARQVSHMVPTVEAQHVEIGQDWPEEILAKALENSDLVIAAADSPNLILYKRVNDLCLEAQVTWMIASMDGTVGLVGPTFIPHKTCCYVCYEMRLESNMVHHSIYQTYKSTLTDLALHHQQTYFGLPNLADIIAGYATYDCVRSIGTGYGLTGGKTIRLDFQNAVVEINDVMKLPRCPACGKIRQGRPNMTVFHTYDRVIKDLEI